MQITSVNECYGMYAPILSDVILLWAPAYQSMLISEWFVGGVSLDVRSTMHCPLSVKRVSPFHD